MAELTCEATGIPAPSYLWFKGQMIVRIHDYTKQSIYRDYHQNRFGKCWLGSKKLFLVERYVLRTCNGWIMCPGMIEVHVSLCVLECPKSRGLRDTITCNSRT